MSKKSVICAILYTSGNIEVKRIDNPLSALQHIVGGHIEAVYDPHCMNGHAYVNDEGLILGLPLNANAEKYLGVRICGNAILLTHDAHGDEDDISVIQCRELLNAVFGFPK